MKYHVEIYEIRKVTFHVEMDDLPEDEIRDDFKDFSPEERAMAVALEGDGIEIESEYIDFFDYGGSPDADKYRPSARLIKERPS